MGKFAFTCQACGSELEIDDESRGEMDLCPHCQAAIKIPLVRAPQVRIPEEQVPTPRPKKKMVLSQQNAATLASAGRPRSSSGSGFMVGALVGVVIGLGIGLCSPVRLSSLLSGEVRVPPALSALRPSKVEWKSKLLQNYALQNNRICAPAGATNQPPAGEKYSLQGFQLALGQPDKIETVGSDKALCYECNDGQVQVLINSTNYDAGQVLGALINDE